MPPKTVISPAMNLRTAVRRCKPSMHWNVFSWMSPVPLCELRIRPNMAALEVGVQLEHATGLDHAGLDVSQRLPKCQSTV